MKIRLPKSWRFANSGDRSDSELAGCLNAGIELEGRMSIPGGTMRLDAHFKGEIFSSGSIIVAERGEVEGAIRAREVSVAGKVKGSLEASERVLIGAEGAVTGEIYTPSLTVEPGGFFDGECHPAKVVTSEK